MISINLIRFLFLFLICMSRILMLLTLENNSIRTLCCLRQTRFRISKETLRGLPSPFADTCIANVLLQNTPVYLAFTAVYFSITVETCAVGDSINMAMKCQNRCMYTPKRIRNQRNSKVLPYYLSD